MKGYNSASYGDGFADVYDDWYATVTDVDATVERMLALVGTGGSVLELGIGTGRLAVPMSDAGLVVTGVDSSAAMLAKLEERDPDRAVTAILGDMVVGLPDGPFDAALVAYNTMFNITDAEAQASCFRAVADRLRVGGTFVVEAFVPSNDATTSSDITVRSMAVDHVVLSVSQNDAGDQRASGQFVEITEAGGVTLRPWSIRWSTPEQLDAMAADAGLDLLDRFSGMHGDAFDSGSEQHVSVYEKRSTA